MQNEAVIEPGCSGRVSRRLIRFDYDDDDDSVLTAAVSRKIFPLICPTCAIKLVRLDLPGLRSRIIFFQKS